MSPTKTIVVIGGQKLEAEVIVDRWLLVGLRGAGGNN
jgi:hypothetical protein